MLLRGARLRGTNRRTLEGRREPNCRLLLWALQWRLENRKNQSRLSFDEPLGHCSLPYWLYGTDVFSRTSDEANGKYDGLSTLYGTVSHYYRLKSLAGERRAIVRLLLKSGAYPSIDTIIPSDGNPMWTSSLWDIDVITALFVHGMNVNHRYSNLDEISLLNYCIEITILNSSVVKKSFDIVYLSSC